MITGTPPFQSPSQYLIFKKIERLEYTFTEGFNEEAKDLIQKLLVTDPQMRLGVKDKILYSSLRAHPFFKGIIFEQLAFSTPPALLPYVAAENSPDPCWARNPEAKPGADRIHLLMVEDRYSSSSSDSSDVESEHHQLYQYSAAASLSDAARGTGTTQGDDGSSSSSITGNNTLRQHSKVLLKSSDSINNILRKTKKASTIVATVTEEVRQKMLAEQRASNKYDRFLEGHLLLKQGKRSFTLCDVIFLCLDMLDA